MRAIEIEPALAEALGRLAAARGKASSARVRLEDLEAVEREFGVRLSDPVIAYVAAGASVWGDGPLAIAAIRERTLTVRDHHEDWGDELDRPFAVIDDDSSGNYIAVFAADRASEAVYFFDHEVGYRPDGPALSLADEIGRALDDLDGVESAGRFSVELYSEPDRAPAVEYASHPKFGRGQVIATAGDVVTVRFDAGEKKLKRSFLTFE